MARLISPIPGILAALLISAIVGGCSSAPPLASGDYGTVLFANAGQEVNSSADDFAAMPLRDRMYFTSNRHSSDTVKDNEDTWIASIVDGRFASTANAGSAFNTARDEGTLSVAPDGITVYFTMCWAPNGVGDADLYTAMLDREGRPTRVRNLAEINSKYWDSNPFITADGNELYFSSDRPGGRGGTDLWVSRKLANGKWGSPTNLGSTINSRYDEKAPWVLPDNATLIFSSDGITGSDGFDLYMAKRELVDTKPPKPWGNLTKLGFPFSTDADDLFLRASAEEDTLYLASNRRGGMGGLDIYLCTSNPFKDTSRYKTTLAIMVLDSTTRDPLPRARYRVSSPSLETSGEADQYGRIALRVLRGQNYHVAVDAAGYAPESASFPVPRSYPYREMRREIGLGRLPEKPVETPPVKEEEPFVIHFDFDRSELTRASVTALDEFLAGHLRPLLDRGADFELIIDAHADDVGSETYNVALSQRRGDAVIRWLRDKGVPLGAMSLTAHGETQPATSNATDEGRGINRRAELRLRLTP